MKHHIILIILIFAYLVAKSDIETIDLGYDYYITKPGYYLIYTVDSICFDDFIILLILLIFTKRINGIDFCR